MRLIEEHKGLPGRKTAPGIKRGFGPSILSLGGWLGRISFLKDRLKVSLKRDNKLSLLDIKMINSSLLVCIILFTVYFVFSFSLSWKQSDKLPGLDLNPQSASALSLDTQELGLKKTVSYYMDKVASRDIFRMGRKDPEAAKKGVSEAALEATQHLKLVGISWSNNPDAMIEDSKAMRTFFLKRGQMIGDVKVEAIFRDRVILNYAGEDIELK